MALTDFLCLITENIIAIPVIDANIPQKQKSFIILLIIFNGISSVLLYYLTPPTQIGYKSC